MLQIKGKGVRAAGAAVLATLSFGLVHPVEVQAITNGWNSGTAAVTQTRTSLQSSFSWMSYPVRTTQPTPAPTYSQPTYPVRTTQPTAAPTFSWFSYPVQTAQPAPTQTPTAAPTSTPVAANGTSVINNYYLL